MFKTLLQYLETKGITRLLLKILPGFYSTYPSEEIDYLLFITEAICTRTDISSVISQQERLPIQSNRLEGIKKAEKNALEIIESTDFKSFWTEILEPNLELRHGAKPVHSHEEIEKLARSFPKNILQFNVYKEGVIVAGATIFESDTVAHVQYISADEEKQQLGGLDFLFEYLINQRFTDKKYFDFGISNENQGKNLNKGLLYWKETFGARSISCKFYKVATANHTKFDSVLL